MFEPLDHIDSAYDHIIDIKKERKVIVELRVTGAGSRGRLCHQCPGPDVDVNVIRPY